MGNPITDTMFGLRDFGRRLLARPDALMLELGAGGELLVSQMRAALAMLLPLLPLINVIGGGKLRESMIGLLGAVLGHLGRDELIDLRCQPVIRAASADFDGPRKFPVAHHLGTPGLANASQVLDLSIAQEAITFLGQRVLNIFFLCVE